MQPSDLMELEQIKQLKARYFRLIDTRRWAEWADLFTEDVVATFQTVSRDTRFEGRPALVQGVKTFLADAVTVHHGHMPELELTGPATAHGIWAMYDIVRKPETTLHGYGHYEEDYVKQDGTWRIKTLRLTRLHTELLATAAS
jgi:uncharacterized protein (TIGR02246 family)